MSSALCPHYFLGRYCSALKTEPVLLQFVFHNIDGVISYVYACQMERQQYTLTQAS